MPEVCFSQVRIFIILICTTKILCQVERFAPAGLGEEQVFLVDDKNVTEHEFTVYEENIPEEASSYWCVQAALNNLDTDHAEPVEIIITDGKDVKAFKLPVGWYNEKSQMNVISLTRKVHLCHDGHLTVNNSLRVIMNTRSVKPINVSLTVTIFSDSQKWKEDQFSEKLSFNSDSNTSVSQPVLKEIIPQMLQKFNQNDYLLIQIKQPSSENGKCLIATIQEAGCPQNPDFLEGGR